jgi:hypothetical protein
MSLGGCYLSLEMLEDGTLAELVISMMLQVADERGVAARPIGQTFERDAELIEARRELESKRRVIRELDTYLARVSRERDDFEQRLHAYRRGEL